MEIITCDPSLYTMDHRDYLKFYGKFHWFTEGLNNKVNKHVKSPRYTTFSVKNIPSGASITHNVRFVTQKFCKSAMLSDLLVEILKF